MWTKANILVVNYSAASSEFLVRSLGPGKTYRCAVTAFNSRGAAKPVYLNITTLNETDIHIIGK